MCFKLLVLSCAAFTLNGCVSLTGGATYTYNRTSSDTCSLEVNTGRVLEGGVTVSLDECDVTVSAGKTTSGSNAVSDVVNLITLLGKVNTTNDNDK